MWGSYPNHSISSVFLAEHFRCENRMSCLPQIAANRGLNPNESKEKFISGIRRGILRYKRGAETYNGIAGKKNGTRAGHLADRGGKKNIQGRDLIKMDFA